MFHGLYIYAQTSVCIKGKCSITVLKWENKFPHLLSTSGTATAGVFFKPSIISGALSPYILVKRSTIIYILLIKGKG